MEGRDPDAVSAAARAADPHKGLDAELDRLLGDALANVLMHPEAGLDRLESWRQPTDPAWVAALGGAILRHPTPAPILARHPGLLAPVSLSHPVVAQVRARALRDPALGWATLAEVVGACVLLDGQPTRGRRSLVEPASPNLIAAAKALGATRVVMGRPTTPADGDPAAPREDWACETGRLVPGEALPARPPRDLTLGVTDGATTVYLNLRTDGDRTEVYGTSRLPEAERWLQAAAELDTLGGTPDAAATLRARMGPGLKAR